MDCQEIQDQLSSFIDESLDDESVTIVDAHLAVCSECRSEKDALVSLNAALTRTLHGERKRAEVVAESVLRQRDVMNERTSSTTPSKRPKRRLLSYLMAVAAGFVLAIGLLPPWRGNEVPKWTSGESRPVAQPIGGAPQWDTQWDVVPAARLLMATGSVMVRPQGDESWTSLQQQELPNYSCPSDSSVRTDAGAICELQTTTGSRIRMNESCEIALHSNEELELVEGQIWCRTAEDGVFRVVTRQQPEPTANSRQLLTLVCPTSTESLTSCSTEGPLQVVAAEGTVEVIVDGKARSLTSGTFCTISDGDIIVRESAADLLHTESWMQPLLTLAGHGNAELTERVDALLANLGRTKLSYFYEQDLRSLGEYAALPLMKFVQSDASRPEPSRRRHGMAIIKDTAPVWMIPDLIALLEDDDATIRRLSAESLERLTGQNQGLTAADWQSNRSRWSTAVKDWQSWWIQHGLNCTPPPDNRSPIKAP